MKKAIITLLVIFHSFTTFSQDPFKLNLKSVASITFPNKPQRTIYYSSDTIYYLSEADTTSHIGTYYQAQAVIVNRGLKDLLNEHFLDSLYNREIRTIVTFEKGKLYYQEPICVDGLKGVEFCATDHSKPETIYSYQRIFYLNKVSIAYGVWSYDSLQRNSKESKAFFNTFKLFVRRDKINQGDAKNLLTKFGYPWGPILIAAIMCLIGLGIVFLIKRLAL